MKGCLKSLVYSFCVHAKKVLIKSDLIFPKFGLLNLTRFSVDLYHSITNILLNLSVANSGNLCCMIWIAYIFLILCDSHTKCLLKVRMVYREERKTPNPFIEVLFVNPERDPTPALS